MKKEVLENLSLKTKLKYLCMGSFLLLAPVMQMDIKAQSPGIAFNTVHLGPEDLMKPMNTMMEKIYNIKMSGDFDKDYVSIMKEFQQGGIDLCKIYEMSGEDPKLLENARVNVVELKEDQKLLKACCTKETKTYTSRTEPSDLIQTLNKMMKGMGQKGKSGNLNDDYAALMVLYNWANTEMAKAELRYGQNTELKNRSSDIITEFSCHENALTEWIDKTIAEK